MTWSNGSRIRLVVVGFVAMVLLGAATANADFTFGEPINLGPGVNSGYSESGPAISPNGLELYFESNRPVEGLDEWNLWVATRQTQDDDWGEPVPLGPEINSALEDDWPQISPDGLELYFARQSANNSPLDIWITRRSTLSESWEPAVNLGAPINTADSHEYSASITADGLELYFSSDRPMMQANNDIWVAKRVTKNEPWGVPVNLGPIVNTLASECLSCISPDGLVLCFSSHPGHWVRPGGFGGSDIWVSTRPTRDDPWGPPWNPGPPLNTSYADCLPSFSADGRWLYFSDFWWNSPQEVRPGGHGGDDLWKAPIIPIVDFNGDGKADGKDVLALANGWGTDDALFDIGPLAWGNNVVDVEDLKVLAEYIGKEVVDVTLIAHWALDEAEGTIAQDSARDNDGTVMGACAWQPASGQVNGALACDGATSIVTDRRVLNPSDGPFSVLAWIKGGAPGQVIVSQDSGSDWLAVDPDSGGLMTTIAPPKSRNSTGLLSSDATIIDGLWHRVALVWDGATRSLYVDATLVATDEQDSLVACTGGLNIGCGANLEPTSFFSGLIDDVRIYNRAVRP